MYHFIVNPASKTGKGAILWERLEKHLKEENIEYTVHISNRPGHVIEIASELTKDLNESINIVVLGGDGTMNEVLQGINNFEKTNVGYIPTGSSNDLARDLKLPKDQLVCLKEIINCKAPTQMDLGTVSYNTTSGTVSRQHEENIKTTRYFDVSTGIGYDAAVCEEALNAPIKNILNKLGLGKLVYLFIALKQLITTKAMNAVMTLDNKTQIQLPSFLFACFMIHQYEGGGFKFCPGADSQDGLLDICVGFNISKLKVLQALPQAAKGNHFKYDGIERFQAKTITIETERPCWVHTDGEVSVQSDSITITCHQKMLNLLR